MIKSRLIFSFISVTLISCQYENDFEPDSIDLKSDSYISDIFTEKEIKEIEKMVSYVDNKVLSNAKTKDINHAYHTFLDKLDRTIQDSSRYLVLFEEEKKYQFLESLDPVVFNEFWHMSNHTRMARYKDTLYRDLKSFKTLSLTPVGRYVEYIEKVGEKDEFYKSLGEYIELAGDLTPGIANWFPKYNQKFDFTIPKNRLWAAVYILRIEEHHDKKMERYLKKQNSMQIVNSP